MAELVDDVQVCFDDSDDQAGVDFKKAMNTQMRANRVRQDSLLTVCTQCPHVWFCSTLSYTMLANDTLHGPEVAWGARL